MSTRRHLLARLAAAAVCVAAGTASAAPVAGAEGVDPVVYETGVPFGQVEHGVYEESITGSAGNDYNRRIEYWLTADKWREQTTDMKTGELIGGRLHDSGGTTWLQYKPINNDPKVLHFNGNDSVPGPGYAAPFNRLMRTTGTMEGSDEMPVAITLQPLGARTIAGRHGTAFQTLRNGQPNLVGPHGPVAGSGTVLVLEDGTDKPLLRESTADNGSYGTFDERESLISRETTPIAGASVKFTKAAFKRTVANWKAKVAAFKKKHKKTHR